MWRHPRKANPRGGIGYSAAMLEDGALNQGEWERVRALLEAADQEPGGEALELIERLVVRNDKSVLEDLMRRALRHKG